MCGIAGFIDKKRRGRAVPLDLLARAMCDRIRHRGPDDCGEWSDCKTGVSLGHRRLSIIDLSPMGQQPMVSSSGRYVLVYNGELYNFERLRAELKDDAPKETYAYRGKSDTEVMLAAFDRWGVSASVPKFNGMFAFAVWDRREEILQLGRDRVGQKPLYYGWVDDSFLFASELKAFQAYPDFTGEIDRRSVALFLKYLCVPAPHSIYQDIYKLPPGCILDIPLHTVMRPMGFDPRPCSENDGKRIAPLRYWSATEIATNGIAEPFMGSVDEADAQLESLLTDAVGMRMVADVPLGVLLSGGVDSSTIAALMQAKSSRPVKTFSIGFKEDAFDEAGFARKVAAHLKTDHTELYVSPDAARDVIPQLPRIYDEPFADDSQIPTYLVSQLAKQHVTVALSGDGGDEVFGGYNRYFVAPAIWKRIRWLPLGLRKILARLMLMLNKRQWSATEPLLAYLFKDYGKQGTFGDKLEKVASVLSMSGPDALYQRLCSAWEDPEQALRQDPSFAESSLEDSLQVGISEQVPRMMLLDLLTYLPDDIMTKVDRASMAVSLETRSPFLDHNVIEFAWSLPQGMKIGERHGKLPLRRLLYKYVPQSLIERPKTGFGVPIAEWLRGPLRDWAEDHLSAMSLRDSGYFEPMRVREIWTQHLTGKRNHDTKLWNVLMFQEWLKSQKRTPLSTDP